MSDPTPAQEEFAAFLAKNNQSDLDHIHPDDRDAVAREREEEEQSEDEEDRYRAAQIDAAMRMPTMDSRADIRLPPADFDRGRSTGVKGVIADARSYETARRTRWKEKVRAARRSVFGGPPPGHRGASSEPESDGSGAEDPDEEAFLRQWRESRLRELEEESRNPVRNRRTSPSVRMYGRFDHVDALGYLDAIEKVGRETVVVVFVYDHEVGVYLNFLLSWLFAVLTEYNSVMFQQPSSPPWCPLSPLTRPSASSKFTTRTSSLTTPACRPFSHTGTRATSFAT
jgi:hypothetical protein